MEITRRTDYAIRMMLELARSGGAPVSVRTLAERQGVPYAFARAVQRDLAAAGLVYTKRGATGGVVLCCDPAEVTLLRIIEATQGTPSVAVCANDASWCSRSGGCAVHQVWRGADEMLSRYLGSKTLEGLISEEGR